MCLQLVPWVPEQLERIIKTMHVCTVCIASKTNERIIKTMHVCTVCIASKTNEAVTMQTVTQYQFKHYTELQLFYCTSNLKALRSRAVLIFTIKVTRKQNNDIYFCESSFYHVFIGSGWSTL